MAARETEQKQWGGGGGKLLFPFMDHRHTGVLKLRLIRTENTPLENDKQQQVTCHAAARVKRTTVVQLYRMSSKAEVEF